MFRGSAQVFCSYPADLDELKRNSRMASASFAVFFRPLSKRLSLPTTFVRRPQAPGARFALPGAPPSLRACACGAAQYPARTRLFQIQQFPQPIP
jgi:hypothetical protein